MKAGRLLIKMCFYNDNDLKVAAWLRELIRRGHLQLGIVDTRSIVDVQPEDCHETSHFFAGIGGWPYALRLAGWPDDRPVWTASLPCQPFSAAGQRKGFKDERNLWPHFHRLVRERKPSVIFGEQVAGAVGFGWLDRVFADLEACAYACGAVVLGAHSVGAPHIRQRLFWVAHTIGEGWQGAGQAKPRWDSQAARRTKPAGTPMATLRFWSTPRPGFQSLAHGIPARVGRLRGYGNAIVPQVAAEFVKAFLEVCPTTPVNHLPFDT